MTDPDPTLRQPGHAADGPAGNPWAAPTDAPSPTPAADAGGTPSTPDGQPPPVSDPDPAPVYGPTSVPDPAPVPDPASVPLPAFDAGPAFGSEPAYGVAPPGPVIAQIGELAVTSSTVYTPAGEIPLRGSTWHITDHWIAEQKIPSWAVVMAIVGFCLLTVFSLLFLLVKETVYRGTVQVTVTNGPRQYVARIPVTDQAQVQYLYQQVNYVRSLAAL